MKEFRSLSRSAEHFSVPGENPIFGCFREAVREIRAGRCGEARKILSRAAAMDLENPEIFNLLGISYEMEGNRVKAARFYRVAYYMDQSFAASSKNLGRVGGFLYGGTSEICWGLDVSITERK